MIINKNGWKIKIEKSDEPQKIIEEHYDKGIQYAYFLLKEIINKKEG